MKTNRGPKYAFIGTKTPPPNLNSIDGLVAWYDISDASTLTVVSGKVSQIRDKSVSGSHLNQANAAKRPAYSASGGSNNKPFITIDGNCDIGIAGLNIPKPFSIYAVVKFNDFVERGMVYQLGSSANQGLSTKAFSGLEALTLVNTVAWRPVSNNFYFENQWSSVNAIFGTTLFFDYRSSYMSFNKSRNYLFHDSPGAAAITEFHIGSNEFTANASISEILVFNNKLSDSNDNKVKQYLLQKYDLPYKLSAYFHGDSITEGYNGSDPITNGFATLVANGIGAVCYNYGFSGTGVPTIGNGKELQSIVHLSQGGDDRDYVFFAYGTNDTYSEGWINTYKSIIQAYIDQGKELNKLVLLTPPYQSTHATKYEEMIPALEAMANELGIIFINVHDHTLENGGDDLLTDGIHPSDEGHTVIANYIISQLGF